LCAVQADQTRRFGPYENPLRDSQSNTVGHSGCGKCGHPIIEEIDLGDIAFGKKTKVSFKEDKNHLSGTLTVTDGTHTANLTLLGQYSTGNFSLASDGHGGTVVTDPLVGSAGQGHGHAALFAAQT